MFENQTVLITGGSSGIGLELARLFAAEKSRLILVSREEALLLKARAELSGRFSAPVTLIPLDLARADSAENLLIEIKKIRAEVDVLVNDAGFGLYGKFWEEALGPQLEMITLHVATLTALVHAFLPPMLQRGRGAILNVSSTAAFQPIPLENVYAATKAYILHFTEALAEELRGTPIKVTCLCPGPTRTPFFDNPHLKSWTPGKVPRMPPELVAKLGFEALKGNRHVVMPGLLNKLLTFGNRFAPRGILVRIVRKMIEMPPLS